MSESNSSRVSSGAAPDECELWPFSGGPWGFLVHLLGREEEPNKDEVRKVQVKGVTKAEPGSAYGKGHKSVHPEFQGHLPICGVWDHSQARCLQKSGDCHECTGASVNAGDSITHLQKCGILRRCVDEGNLWILVALLDIGTVEHTRDPGASATPAFKACGWRSFASHDVECLQYLFWLVVFVSFSFRVQRSTKKMTYIMCFYCEVISILHKIVMSLKI